MPWEKVSVGSNSKRSTKAQVITIRPAAFAFNATFMRANKLLRMERVTIHVDKEERRLGFQFHNDKEALDSYVVTGDGGGRGGNSHLKADGRAVQASNLLKQDWLSALLRNRSVRKFEPYQESNLWVINLGPSFEVEVTNPLEVPAEVSGVYRYLDGDEVTYIGRGRIRQRMQDSQREQWSYDRVQFSPLNNVAEEQKWEQILIMEHEEKYHRLPRENRVRGYISNDVDPSASS